jgi:hypothetical protein
MTDLEDRLRDTFHSRSRDMGLPPYPPLAVLRGIRLRQWGTAVTAGLLLSALVALGTIGVRWANGLGSTGNHPTGGTPSVRLKPGWFPMRLHGLPPPPHCPSPPPASAILAIETPAHQVRFSHDCYSAPADQPFTIQFTNAATALTGAPGGTALNISIYRSQAEAVNQVGDALEVDQGKALFVGAVVIAPGVGTYHVPSLAPGRYYIQGDTRPDLAFATLIVE